MKIFLLGFAFILTTKSQAFTLVISNPQYTGAGVAIKSQLDTLATGIQDTFNSSVASTNNQKNFLTSVSNANADAHSGYIAPGVIPANSRWFVNVGGSMSLALGSGSSLSSGIKFPSNQLPPIGVAAQTGITAGVSTRYIQPLFNLDPSRTLYTMSFSTMDLSGIGKGVSLKMTQASLGVMYQLYNPISWTPLFRYNGIQLASGISYSTFLASYSTPFNLVQTDSSTGAQMSWTNNVDIGVTSSVVSLTNQATTGIRALAVLNLYTGLGLDLNFGSSSITGGSNGTLTGSLNGSSVYTSTTTVSGNGESAGPTPVTLRYLLGTEFDVGVIGVYIQGHVSTAAAYGLNAGAHIAF